MKNFFKITFLIALVVLVSCKDDNSEPGNVTTETLTANSWSHAQVTHSDGDLSDQYTDFVILFTDNASDGFDGTFAISNGGNAFSESAGYWKFNADKTKIIFDSGKEIDFTLDENHLQLDFTTTSPGGKVVGLIGHFTFDLQPL